MAKTSALYEGIGRLFGREKMRELGHLIKAAGLNLNPEAFAGFYVVLSLTLSFLSSTFLLQFYPARVMLFRFSLWVFKPLVISIPPFVLILSALISIIAVFASIGLAIYVFLLLSADQRRKKIDEVLPDFLTLASANVRAGMTIDQAMWYAAKPEFGLLSKEVETVAKQTFGGMPFPDALDGLGKRVNSKNVKRMISLIKQGLASGGELAEILERTSEDTRNMQIIKKDIAASLLMYVIFIVFAAAIGTPFLFAVSSKLIVILESVFSQIPDTADLASAGSTFIKPSPPMVSSDQFFLFVLVSSAITAFFSSMMMGVILKGTKREGIKYLPFITISAVVIFFIISSVLDNFLQGISGF